MREIPKRGLAAVAQEAGVSAMTVSRVLRNSPQVSRQTRARVLAAVAKTNYAPDPLVAQLMERVRLQRHTRQYATLAFVYNHPAAAGDAHNYMNLEDLRVRAASHGYRVEPFRLGVGGVSQRRLQTILETRGIRGVLLSVSASASAPVLPDFSRFAMVTFGFGLASPSLHRASTNITEGMLDIYRRLQARGYRRIGLAITAWADVRAGHTYSGSLLHHQQSLPALRRIPMLLFPDQSPDKYQSSFERWLRKYRPDVLISFYQPVRDWLTRLGLRMPQDIGLLSHDWLPGMGTVAGMDHRRREVAAAAVDLLCAHLQHNEYGIPEVPRQILIPPLFIDAESIRPQQTAKKSK